MIAPELPAGTRLEPISVNIGVNAEYRVTSIGVGYHLRTPGGRVMASGYTWTPPPKRARQLQRVVDELLKAAEEHEGI